jgi:hypothetical protein
MYALDGLSVLYTITLNGPNHTATSIGSTGQDLQSIEFGANGKLYAGGVFSSSYILFQIPDLITGVAVPVPGSDILPNLINGLTLVPEWDLCSQSICGPVDPSLVVYVASLPPPPDPSVFVNLVTPFGQPVRTNMYESICPIDDKNSLIKLCLTADELFFNVSAPIPHDGSGRGRFIINVGPYLMSRGYDVNLNGTTFSDRFCCVVNLYIKLAGVGVNIGYINYINYGASGNAPGTPQSSLINVDFNTYNSNYNTITGGYVMNFKMELTFYANRS